MHLFDTLVNAPVAISSAALSCGAFAYACFRVQRTLPRSRMPLLGLSAAFVFAAQMLNFPVPGGASGHLLGASLMAVLLGPSAGIISMSAVVILQCFLFADGGVSALGANLFNMAVAGAIVAYGAYRAALAVLGSTRLPLAAGIAAWFSVVVAAALCGGQIALSGHGSPPAVIGAMVGIHAVIGIGEAVITAMVVAALAKARPELLLPGHHASADSRLGAVAVFGLLLSLGLAIFISPFACPLPDGMEHVVARLGIDPEHIQPIWRGLMPSEDVSPGWFAAAAGGGTLALFFLGWMAVRIIAASRPMPQRQPADVVDTAATR